MKETTEKKNAGDTTATIERYGEGEGMKGCDATHAEIQNLKSETILYAIY